MSVEVDIGIMSKPMEQSASLQNDEADLSLKEWSLKARISRENTTSRRFSASNLKSFREAAPATSFRSNITISSTASSPGFTLKEEIDPSTYSFTTALKALQAKTVYTWEYQSAEAGLTLNSKWYDAEKYICNPLSGEVPLECLSAKTLTARSFGRITMSAPLIYPPNIQNELDINSKEKKRGPTRDVGTQSTPLEISSSSPSPASTPSPVKASDSSGKLKSERQVEKNGGERKKQTMCRCRSEGGGGCLSLSFWTTTRHHRDKSRSTTPPTSKH